MNVSSNSGEVLREDASRKARDELEIVNKLGDQFRREMTIETKRKIQEERLSHATSAAALFCEAKDTHREAASYLAHSLLLLELMLVDSDNDKRTLYSHQVLGFCESTFRSLKQYGRLDVMMRGLAKIVEHLSCATVLVDEAANPKLGDALRTYSEALVANIRLMEQMEAVGYDCLANSVRLGVYSKYAIDLDRGAVLRLKQEFDSQAKRAFDLTRNSKLLEEVERVSAETRGLEDVREVQTVQFCEGCGKQVPADTLYCPSCGRRQYVEERSFCEGCGKQIAAGLAYCPSCGRKQPVL